MFRFTGQMPSVAEFAEERPFGRLTASAAVSDPSHFSDGFRSSAPSPFAGEGAFAGITERHGFASGSIHSNLPDDSL
jgi:hypothetical protein